MHYPSIEEYKEAVIVPESFATLSYLQPVKDPQGFPVFIAGGPAVVFKMQDSRNRDKRYALKCFTQEQPRRKRHFEAIHQCLKKLDSPYFVDYQYLENELWVNEAEYPVLLMEWIEGITMSQKIEELCSTSDKHGLAQLVYDFNNMAIWMLQQDFAHGDIKPENIQVMPSGNLKLVDYDGMFVPAFEGETAPELGTAEYRHPRRKEEDFNAHLDDFPLLLLSLSLMSLQKKPELYETDHQGDSLLFRVDDYKALQKSKYYPFFTQEVAEDENIRGLFGLLQYAVSIPVLKLIGLENVLAKINEKLYDIESFETVVDPNERTWEDKYGVTYSLDRKKLIKGNRALDKYTVIDGTVIICDKAFFRCKNLKEIQLPYGLQSIGESVFGGDENLEKIYLPDSLKKIGNWIFANCKKLTEIHLSSRLSSIGICAFKNCDNLVKIHLPDGLNSIGSSAFFFCIRLTEIYLPDSLQTINGLSFLGCRGLTRLYIPIGCRSHFEKFSALKKYKDRLIEI